MNRKNPPMAFDVLFAAVTAVVASIGDLGFLFIAFFVFLWITATTVRSRLSAKKTRTAVVGACLSIFVFGGLITAAGLYRPTKIVERCLQRSVTLPASRMTLAELSYLAAFRRDLFPLQVSFYFADEDKEVVVEWPRPNLTIREFLDAIESQTKLRRRFMHCGNGYTILGGGDCSFGLSVRDRDVFGQSFDVDAYAARKSKASLGSK